MQTHRLIRVDIPSIVRCWDAERREDKFPSLRNLSCGEERLRERVGCSGQKALVSAGRQAEMQKGFPQPFKCIRRTRDTPVSNGETARTVVECMGAGCQVFPRNAFRCDLNRELEARALQQWCNTRCEPCRQRSGFKCTRGRCLRQGCEGPKRNGPNFGRRK